MVGGLKIVQVKAGHKAEFQSLFAAICAEVQRQEPGCLLYSLLKSRAKPGAYFPQMRAILEQIDVEYFDGVEDKTVVGTGGR
jgi:quinol monooxygenase YgiN